LIDRLTHFYGPLPLPPEDPFAFYVWEVLGTLTTAGRRDTAIEALRRVPALTPDSLRKLGRGRLQAVVRQCGPFVDERLAALDAGIDIFRRQHQFVQRLRGPLRHAWLAARDLPHLGHAGALRLLLYTGETHVVPVDAGMARIATRLGIARPLPNVRRLTREVRRALDLALPREQSGRRRAVLYLQHHSEHTCVESSPHCAVCPLLQECAEGRSRVGADVSP
jgi:endonuclease III